MTNNELLTKVREMKELQQMADELTTEIESLKDELKAEMTQQNTDELKVDVFTIHYKTVSTSRFDTKTFKAQHSDLYTAYTKATTSKRFTIS